MTLNDLGNMKKKSLVEKSSGIILSRSKYREDERRLQSGAFWLTSHLNEWL